MWHLQRSITLTSAIKSETTKHQYCCCGVYWEYIICTIWCSLWRKNVPFLFPNHELFGARYIQIGHNFGIVVHSLSNFNHILPFIWWPHRTKTLLPLFLKLVLLSMMLYSLILLLLLFLQVFLFLLIVFVGDDDHIVTIVVSLAFVSVLPSFLLFVLVFCCCWRRRRWWRTDFTHVHESGDITHFVGITETIKLIVPADITLLCWCWYSCLSGSCCCWCCRLLSFLLVLLSAAWFIFLIYLLLPLYIATIRNLTVRKEKKPNAFPSIRL